jgi:hypothetical protein
VRVVGLSTSPLVRPDDVPALVPLRAAGLAVAGRSDLADASPHLR